MRFQSSKKLETNSLPDLHSAESARNGLQLSIISSEIYLLEAKIAKIWIHITLWKSCFLDNWWGLVAQDCGRQKLIIPGFWQKIIHHFVIINAYKVCLFIAKFQNDNF